MRVKVYLSCVELCESKTWTVKTENEMALHLEGCSVGQIFQIGTVRYAEGL